MKPSGVKTKPEPEPCTSWDCLGSTARREAILCPTIMWTTEGLTFSDALITAWEYASRICSSAGGVVSAILTPLTLAALSDIHSKASCISFVPLSYRLDAVQGKALRRAYLSAQIGR